MNLIILGRMIGSVCFTLVMTAIQYIVTYTIYLVVFVTVIRSLAVITI